MPNDDYLLRLGVENFLKTLLVLTTSLFFLISKHLLKHLHYESANLGALRSKNVLACQRVLRVYLLMCQRALRVDVLTCQSALRAYELTCLRALRTYVLTC